MQAIKVSNQEAMKTYHKLSEKIVSTIFRVFSVKTDVNDASCSGFISSIHLLFFLTALSSFMFNFTTDHDLFLCLGAT